jgi:hypothetical protein
VWKEELRIRAISTTDYERRKATREKKTGIMKDERRGKRLKRYEDGWTDHKREYYQQLLGIFKNLKSSDVWNTLQDHWKM